MTKRLNEILSEARERRIVEQYLEYLSDLTEEEAEEEVSQLDELSKKTLGKYLDRAPGYAYAGARFGKEAEYSKDPEVRKRGEKADWKAMNRKDGSVLAGKKLTGRAKVNASEEVETLDLDEAIKIGSKVKVHAPRKSYHGKEGVVGEIRHGLFNGAPKTYTVDYDNGQSVQLRKNNVKIREETLDLGGYSPTAGAEKQFVATHKVKKFADRVGNGDDVYKGNTKPAKYPKADKGGAVASTEEVMRDRT